MLGGGTRASARLSSQRALNAMTMWEVLTPPPVYTPQKKIPMESDDTVQNFAHFASSMVHPTTGDSISSYKRLMNDTETAEVWQTAFGKDFVGMAQGDNKTGQKGTNSVFVMTYNKIDIAKAAGHKWTYTQIVVGYRPQKEDPNRIRIAVRGTLITYGQHINTDGRIHHVKTVMEQCTQHRRSTVYVPQSQELLPHGSLGLLRIHENPISPLPRMDKETI